MSVPVSPSRPRRPGDRAAVAIRVVMLVVLCGFMLLPFAWAIVSSLKPLDAVYAFPPRFTVSNPQWSNYSEAFTRLPVVRFLLNSLLIAAVSMLGAVLSASMTGYALARLQFRGRRIWFALVMISMFIPAHALMAPRVVL